MTTKKSCIIGFVEERIVNPRWRLCRNGKWNRVKSSVFHFHVFHFSCHFEVSTHFQWFSLILPTFDAFYSIFRHFKWKEFHFLIILQQFLAISWQFVHFSVFFMSFSCSILQISIILMILFHFPLFQSLIPWSTFQILTVFNHFKGV